MLKPNFTKISPGFSWLLLPVFIAFLGQSQCDADHDGDGWTIEDGDCNDADPEIHPGADEVCNEVDDDCDGELDEGVLEPFYLDADGDGYGDAESLTEACTAPEGHVANDDDCDDADALIGSCMDFGDGRDGSLDVASSWNLNRDISEGRSWPDGVAWRVLGDSVGISVTLENSSGIDSGDLVLLLALQGSSESAGSWEVLEVESVDGTLLTFAEEPEVDFGYPSDAYLILQRIPQYESVSVSGVLTASAWDGLSSGSDSGRATGVVALKVSGTLTVSEGGSISAEQLGYEGASSGDAPEGPYGYVTSGGGTGSSGGWADGGAGAGTPSSAAGGAGASSCSNSGGAGGLGGGGGGGKITHCAGGSPVTGGGGGGGGAAYDAVSNLGAEDLSLLLLGGGASAGAGGGASGANAGSGSTTAPGGGPAAGSAGYPGGGAILLWANTMAIEGSVRSSGGSGGIGGSGGATDGGGSDDGGGGGGEGGQGAAGGSILLSCIDLTAGSALVTVPGGSGGNGGPGGAGFSGSGAGSGGTGAVFGGSPTSGGDGSYAGDGGASGGGGAGGEAGAAGLIRIVASSVNGVSMDSEEAESVLSEITNGQLSSSQSWEP